MIDATRCCLSRSITLLVVGSAMLLWGCAPKEAGPDVEEHVVSVTVAPVLKSTISLNVAADALLYPLQQAAIVPKISAPVKKFYVERGTRVRAGQLLAELENLDLVAAVAESQAALEQAEANYLATAKGSVPEELQKTQQEVRSTKEALDAQQKLFDSRQTLYREGAISQKDVNEAQVALTQAKSQYEIALNHLETLQSISREQTTKAAAAQRDAAKGRVDSAQAQLQYSRIVSPIDGVVTDRPIYAGEMPPSGSPLITVMDLSEVIARPHISQHEAGELRIGSPARLVPGDGTAPVGGKITVISPALDPGSTTVEVWVQAPNPGQHLKAGSGVRVEMLAQTVKRAMVVPKNAVLTDSSGETSVIIVDSESKPQKRSVTLGISDGTSVQVANGLNEGEQVVTTGAFELGKLDEDVLAKTKVEVQAGKEENEHK
jgi:HlyD family secretion protein